VMYTAGPNTQAKTVECRLPLPVRLPSSYANQVSYSDHEGVEATILIQDKASEDEGGASGNNSVTFRKQRSLFCQDRHNCVQDSVELIRKAQKAVALDQFFYVALCFIASVLFFATFSAFFLTESFLIDYVVFFVRMVLVLSIVYTLFMASLFNKKEKNALMSAAATLQIMATQSKYKSI
jgi:hypothetical protein